MQIYSKCTDVQQWEEGGKDEGERGVTLHRLESTDVSREGKTNLLIERSLLDCLVFIN